MGKKSVAIFPRWRSKVLYTDVGIYGESYLKPLSVTTDSVGSQTEGVSHVDHQSSAHINHSGHSQTDAIIFN